MTVDAATAPSGPAPKWRALLGLIKWTLGEPRRQESP